MESEETVNDMADAPTPEELRFYARYATSLANDAGAIAVAQFGDSSARRKGDGTLVTQTDEQIDRFLNQRIQTDHPTHGLLSEEQNTLYDGSREFTWIVDPIDGTTNFARGLPVWGVSVALLWQGQPVVGVVFFSWLHEMFSAIRGHGAALNDEPIHCAPLRRPDDQHIFMVCTRTPKRLTIDAPLKLRMMGSATYHICKVAQGVAVGGAEATPKVWDLAAASLILSEAGGSMIPIVGAPLFPLDAQPANYAARSYPTLYACNAEMLAALRAVVREKQ